MPRPLFQRQDHHARFRVVVMFPAMDVLRVADPADPDQGMVFASLQATLDIHGAQHPRT
jgi:hypothetical protein